MDWHALDLARVKDALGLASLEGLSLSEAQRRLREGENTLSQRRGPGALAIFFSQFSDFMVLVLISAAVLSGLLGEWSDAITILSIVFLNACLGFIQEYRAERSLAALRELAAPGAVVRRSGKLVKIPAAKVVRGDLVLLSSGDRVPADLRLLQAVELRIDESTLTGESLPVSKKNETLPAQKALAEQSNMAWMGTMVTAGSGEGLVVSTGMETQIGQIAGLLGPKAQGSTPLERRLGQLGKFLVLACGVLCVLVVLLGLFRGEPFEQMLMIGISLAVAAIPEGLPAIVTIALALGVQRMSQRRAIVRQLPAVETLGCVSVICADKTGTLTANALAVQQIAFPQRLLTVTGAGYTPEGEFFEQGRPVAPTDPDLTLLLKIGALCNNARLEKKKTWQRKKWEGSGDPTEIALLTAAAKAGIWRERLLAGGTKLIKEQPFDSGRKMMSVLVADKTGTFLYAKGAPEVILARCTVVSIAGKNQSLTPRLRQKILGQAAELAEGAMRVLALAYRPSIGNGAEEELVFVGLVGMADQVRPGVRQAVAQAKTAGIRTVMITGDHLRTAMAVAKDLGLEPGEAYEEGELAKLTPREFAQVVSKATVFARVTPKRKLAIVEALQSQGEIVAMTGDGVNDAPALKAAAVGVAMGRAGTDVAREASEVVLTDDNFATIVAAVEEGRGIYENIRKFIRYLLGCNVGEIFLMLVASALGLPTPLLPIQLLWVNLVTDGLPAMALGLEPPERELMADPPRDPEEGIFARGLLRKIIKQGLIVGGGSLAAFVIALETSGWDLMEARTVAFCTLVFSQLAFAFRCRSEHHDPRYSYRGNPLLGLSILASFLMQMVVLKFGPLAEIFRTVPLTSSHALLVFFLSHWPFLLFDWLRGLRLKKVDLVKI